MAAQRPRVDRLAVLGLGVGLLGLAATLAPVEVPPILAYAAYGLGAACLVGALLLGLRTVRVAARSAPRRRPPARRTLAGDCSRLQAEIEDLLPHPARRLGRRDHRTDEDVLRMYREELRPIVETTLDEVAKCTSVSSATRTSATGQSVRHLRILSSALSELERDLRSHDDERDVA